MAYDAVLDQARRYPDMRIDALHAEALPPRDAAFAHAIVDATLRRWLLMRFLAEAQLERPWRASPPPVRAALLAGAAQILFLDRVPIHAAVGESVNWVRAEAGPRAGAAVNAILRRIAELAAPEMTEAGAGRVIIERWSDDLDEVPLADGRALALAHPVLPRDPLQRLAITTSHPLELLHSWAKSMTMAEVRRVALHSIVSPPTILNTAHATAPLPDTLTPHSLPGHHVFTGARADLVSLMSGRRDIWVQDPASSLAIQSVAHLEPATIVDACAGKGTKTRQLAATFPNARIIASDIDVVRARELKRVFADDERVETPAFESLIDYAGQADLILLDVPCSNTGVLARRVEARYRFDDSRNSALTETQRQVLADSIRLLRREAGGAILYTTCALDPRENEEQARWVGRWHDLDVVREERRLPMGGPGEPPEGYSDGSYSALLA